MAADEAPGALGGEAGILIDQRKAGPRERLGERPGREGDKGDQGEVVWISVPHIETKTARAMSRGTRAN